MKDKVLSLYDWFLIAGVVICSSIYTVYSVRSGSETLQGALLGSVAGIAGVFCVVLVAKGNIWNYLFGLVNVSLYAWISYKASLYGDACLNAFYYLPMQFIGFNMWKKRTRHDGTATIRTRYMTWRQRWITMASVVIGTIALGVFLIYFGPWMIGVLTEILPDMEFKTLKMDYDTTSQLWLDSFTTVMSIVTMVVSVKAFVEQWYMWLFINVAYIAMWLMSDSVFSFMTVAKYCVYFVNSIYGIYMWNKLSK